MRILISFTESQQKGSNIHISVNAAKNVKRKNKTKKPINACTDAFAHAKKSTEYHSVTFSSVDRSFPQTKSSFGSVASILTLSGSSVHGHIPGDEHAVHTAGVGRAGYQKTTSVWHHNPTAIITTTASVTLNACVRMPVVGSGVNIFIPGKNVFSKQSLDTAEELISP